MADHRGGRRTAKHRARSEEFGVREWLRVGAASAGMGAALFGFSLLGPQVGTASADDSGASSSSSSSSASSSSSSAGEGSSAATSVSSVSSASSASSAGATKTDSGAEGGSTSGAAKAAETAASKPVSTVSASGGANTTEPSTSTPATSTSKSAKSTAASKAGAPKAAAKQSSVSESSATKADDSQPAEGEGDDTGTAGAAPATSAASATSATSGSSATAKSATVGETTATPVASKTSEIASTPAVTASLNANDAAPQANSTITATAAAATVPWALQSTNTVNPWAAVSSAPITGITDSLQSVLNAWPMLQPLRDALLGTVWTVRRTFFNLAPTVAPVGIASQTSGPIAGRVSAVDPEGDPITYALTRGPQYGSVQVFSDGSYVYTPNASFQGVDDFVVSAVDGGFHLNLLDPLRGPAQTAMLVNQGAVQFAFTYVNRDTGDTTVYWSDEAKAALNEAAQALAVHFMVPAPVTLTYTVTSYDQAGGPLASAGSDVVAGLGFQPTVVQSKLQTGVDPNGATADGRISWNWAYTWNLDETQPAPGGPAVYDLRSTAMHEMLHSMGWLSFYSDGYAGQRWTTYDSFVGTRTGVKLVGSDLRFNQQVSDNLTGNTGTGTSGITTGLGMYFLGSHAMAANGGAPVPLYSPEVYRPGSSLSHLDDFSFSGPVHQLMDAFATRPGERYLSSIELGVLADIGYTIVPTPVAPTAGVLALVGIVFLRRAKRRQEQA